MTEPMKWNFYIDAGGDGKVQFRVNELPSGQLMVSMDLPPDVADKIGDALKAHAERARRLKTPRPTGGLEPDTTAS